MNKESKKRKKILMLLRHGRMMISLYIWNEKWLLPLFSAMHYSSYGMLATPFDTDAMFRCTSRISYIYFGHIYVYECKCTAINSISSENSFLFLRFFLFSFWSANKRRNDWNQQYGLCNCCKRVRHNDTYRKQIDSYIALHWNG